jgi:hypothetical protein
MLTRAEKGTPTASRIRGRDSIVKSLCGLLIRVHRFGRHRARTAEDLMWAARTIDALYQALAVADTDQAGGPRR